MSNINLYIKFYIYIQNDYNAFKIKEFFKMWIIQIRDALIWNRSLSFQVINFGSGQSGNTQDVRVVVLQ